MGNFTVERINDFNDFLKLESIWNKLLSQSDSDFPFLTFEWLSCWWKSYGKGSDLYVLLVKNNAEIIGIAPLMKTRIMYRGFRARVIQFIANYHSNRCGFILIKNKKEAVCVIMSYLRRNASEFDTLLLNLIPENSESDIALQAYLGNSGFRFVKMDSSVSPFLAINSEWDDYFVSLPKGLKKEINYRKRLFGTNETYSFKECYGDNIDETLKDLLTVSRTTWQYSNGTAIASDISNINFYSSLAAIAAKKNWLNISFLNTKSGPVAFELKLVYNQITYLLKIGFNSAYSRFSPGIILLENTIKKAFANGSKLFDFLGESDKYKLQWTSACRSHKKYWVYSPTIYGLILYSLENLIVQKIKRFPMLKFLRNLFKTKV